MIDLGAVYLLRPWWLAALVPAVALAVLAARHGDGLARWRRIVDPALLDALRRLGAVEAAGRTARPWLLGGAAALIALALAGPATRNRDAPVFRDTDAIVILLDLSPSITASDALDDAQAAVSRLLDRHGTRPVALVVFAGESFLVGVPSAETRTLQGTVAVIDETTMPLPGSRPDRALALARLTLEDAGAERGDVVLVSDGGGIGPDAEVEARALAAAGARVSAVFAAPSTALQGAPPPRRTAMETIAETGDGLIVDARDVQPLESFLLEHRGVTAGEVERRALVFDDHGRWLVMAAALALLPLFRRRRTT